MYRRFLKLRRSTLLTLIAAIAILACKLSPLERMLSGSSSPRFAVAEETREGGGEATTVAAAEGEADVRLKESIQQDRPHDDSQRYSGDDGSSIKPPIYLTDIAAGIFPGTQRHIEELIGRAEAENSPLVIIRLNTPGGILSTTQNIIEAFFRSRVPIVVYIAPTGGTATSAGVFLFIASHVAAMAPGTSLGAAHPVAGSGANIEGDMREKAVNMATALVKSIAEQRGRNTTWVEQAVRESKSLTESEAVAERVADLMAPDIPTLLKAIKGREVIVNGRKVTIGDLEKTPIEEIEFNWKNSALNVLADPNVAAILWLVATSGIAAELYHPGLIIPGMIGVICLILGLLVAQVIPLNAAGIALLAVGMLLVFAEIYVPSGILGIGGLIAIVLGLLSLVDVELAPDLSITFTLVGPILGVMATILLGIAVKVREALNAPLVTGDDLLKGKEGKVIVAFTRTGEGLYEGRVAVAGENWRARAKGPLDVGDGVRIKGAGGGLALEVERG